MTDSRSRIIDIYLHESALRTVLVRPQRTTTLRLIGGRPVTVLELPADVGFHPDGVVVLPAPPGGGVLTALHVVAAALLHARDAPDLRLLVAAHGPEGTPATDERAAGLAALLIGDRTAWAERCARTASERDRQAVRAWLGDGNPLVAATDWGAAFDRYDAALAGLLELTPAGLPALRSRLRPVDACAVGCGASWPRDRLRLRDLTPTSDERLDVLFFSPADVPELRCHEGGALAPNRCDLYRKNKYRHVPITAAPGRSFIEVRLADVVGQALEGWSYRLLLPDGRAREARVPPDGVVREVDLDPGSCDLLLVPPPGELPPLPTPIEDEPAGVEPGAAGFVEVLLRDAAGEPLAGGWTYRLVLPHGAAREGVVPDDGRLREDGVDPGECRLELRPPGAAQVAPPGPTAAPPAQAMPGAGGRLEVHVRDEAGEPLEGWTYALRLPRGGARTGVVPGDGRIVEAGLAEGAACALELRPPVTA